MPNGSLSEYIQSYTSTRRKSKFNRHHERQLIQNNDINKYDITFLYKLLPIHLNVQEPGSRVYMEKLADTNSFEFLIRKAKDIRYGLAHHTNKATSPGTLDEIMEVSMRLLDSMTNMFGCSQEEVDQSKQEVQEYFQYIQ